MNALADRVANAYHEAGHAVAARVQGITVHYATLDTAEDDTAGAVRVDHAGVLAHEAGASVQMQLAGIRQDIVVCLSGPVAQAYYHRQVVGDRSTTTDVKKIWAVEWKGDFTDAKLFALRAAFIESGIDVFADQLPDEPSTEQIANVDRLLNQCNDVTSTLVADNWPAIVRVAEALYARTTLTSDEIDKLIAM